MNQKKNWIRYLAPQAIFFIFTGFIIQKVVRKYQNKTAPQAYYFEYLLVLWTRNEVRKDLIKTARQAILFHILNGIMNQKLRTENSV